MNYVRASDANSFIAICLIKFKLGTEKCRVTLSIRRLIKRLAYMCIRSRPKGYKTFFMLSLTEDEFILLINVKVPTIVGILIFMSRINEWL